MTSTPLHRKLRRGLPRSAGAPPWPLAGDEPLAARAPDAGTPASADTTIAIAAGAPGAESRTADTVSPSFKDDSVRTEVVSSNLRRGLPRTIDGESWPPAGAARPSGRIGRVPSSLPESVTAARALVTLRRGLPRSAGADKWPPVATVAPPVPREPVEISVRSSVDHPGPSVSPRTRAGADIDHPLPFTRTAWHGAAPRIGVPEQARARRWGRLTQAQWALTVVVGGAGLLFAAAMAVLLVRWMLSVEAVEDFVALFPGEYHLPEHAPVGIPAWLAWQHFFNFFLMILIIRSGLQIRTEKRPAAYWTARNGAKKISLALWFHQSLDILWLVNGVAFVVLLFATGQWMRVVPTSWEVFPNAISAALQYISLDWPTENGWVNYNSLQQIAYFTTIFIAAPLAAITGFRMSGMWPKSAARLSRAYPIEWARAVHFPVMLYFVAFIAVHVLLVLATGALRNLNHMYAAQGSTDPTEYAQNWAGFWMFALSLGVVALALVAARPAFLAPVARLFGTVSGR